MSRELELVAGAAVADGLPGPAKARAGAGPKHAAVHTECLNCGAALHGRFCAACGQAADDHHRSILHLMWEAVEGLFHLDGRLARTLPALFLHPGRLARDHFEGRRQRHVPPFRLFLVTLLLFMLALEGLLHGGGHAPGQAEHAAAPATAKLGDTVTVRDKDGVPHAVQVPTAAQISAWTGGRVSAEEIARSAKAAQPAEPHAGAPSKAAQGRTLSVGGGLIQMGTGAPPPAGLPEATGKADEQSLGYRLGHAAGKGARSSLKGEAAADKALDDFESASEKHSVAGNWFVEKVRKASANKEYFMSVVFGWAHRLAVLLLPIQAAFLTLLYCYKRQFYVYDHLVVAMHFLSFGFLLWGAVYLLPKPVRDIGYLIAMIWTPVNLFMTLRGAYGSGVIGAGVKTVVVWGATMAAFLFLILGLLVIALGQM